MIDNRYRLRVLTAATGLAAMALLGAACGGDGSGGGKHTGTGAAASGQGAPSLDQQLKLARCMRQHGVDMPDPKPGKDPGGMVSIGGNADPRKVETAMKACRQVAGMPAPQELTQAQKDRMLAYAKCMREHGVDMPDPKFGTSGSADEVAAPSGGAEQERFDKADKTCGATFG